MPFKIPNEADVDAAHVDQAEPDSVDFDIIAAAFALDGVVSGCVVTAQGPVTLTVDVAAGTVRITGVDGTISGTTATVGAADLTDPRFDLIVAGLGDIVAVVAGTASSNPVFPAVPASRAVLAAIYIPSGVTAIAANQIVDKRIVLLVQVGITLAADAQELLNITAQELGLVAKAANLILAGPISGGTADPTFRALVDNDIPAAIARDSEVTADIATHAALVAVHHSLVTVSGAPNYLTLAGQDLIRGLIDLTSDVTGLLPSGNIAADIARDSELHSEIHGSGQHGSESDAAAIHDNVAAEIVAITEKLTPVAADLLLIEDSVAANAKKRVQVGNLPGGAGGHTIRDEGTDLAARTGLNFLGPMVDAVDDVGGDESEIRHFSRLYDAIVAPSAEAGAFAGGSIPVFTTVAAAITAGHQNIFVRGDHSGEVDLTIAVGDSVDVIVGADRKSAKMPNVICNRAEVLFQSLLFDGKSLTCGANGIQALRCEFKNLNGFFDQGSVKVDLVVRACVFDTCTDAIRGAVLNSRLSVVSNVFKNCIGAFCVDVTSNTAGAVVTGNIFRVSNTASILVRVGPSTSNIQISGNSFFLSASQTGVSANQFCIISGNIFSGGATAIGVVLIFRNNIVAGNLYRGAPNPCIDVKESANLIANNTFHLSSTIITVIDVSANKGNTTIIGNAFVANTGTVAHVAVDLTAGAEAAKVLISSNTFSSLSIGTLAWAGEPVTGFTADTRIIGNVGVPDNVNTIKGEDDFYFLDIGSANESWVSVASGGLAPALQNAHGGRVRLEATTAGHRSGLQNGTNTLGAFFVFVSGRRASYEAIIDHVVGTPLNVAFRLGYADTWNVAGDPVGGVFFRRSGTGNWFGVIRNAGAETILDLGQATGARFLMRFTRGLVNGSGSRVQFYIDGVLKVTTSTLTNLPINAQHVGGKLDIINTQNQELDVDVIKWEGDRN